MDLLDQMLAEAEADFNVNEHEELGKVWHIFNRHPPKPSQQTKTRCYISRTRKHTYTHQTCIL